jgi:hypothetical protein
LALGASKNVESGVNAFGNDYFGPWFRLRLQYSDKMQVLENKAAGWVSVARLGFVDAGKLVFGSVEPK